MNKGGLVINHRGGAWSQTGQSPRALRKNAQEHGQPP